MKMSYKAAFFLLYTVAKAKMLNTADSFKWRLNQELFSPHFLETIFCRIGKNLNIAKYGPVDIFVKLSTSEN